MLDLDEMCDLLHTANNKITVICGFAHLLDSPGLTDEQKSYLDHISSAAEELIAPLNQALIKMRGEFTTEVKKEE